MPTHGKGQRTSLGHFHGKPLSTKVVHAIRKQMRAHPKTKGNP